MGIPIIRYLAVLEHDEGLQYVLYSVCVVFTNLWRSFTKNKSQKYEKLKNATYQTQ